MILFLNTLQKLFKIFHLFVGMRMDNGFSFIFLCENAIHEFIMRSVQNISTSKILLKSYLLQFILNAKKRPCNINNALTTQMQLPSYNIIKA